MKSRAILLLCLSLVAAPWAGTLVARAQAPVNTDVYIEYVLFKDTTLTIAGRNFGSSTPTVTVGESAAAVARHTDSEIIAETTALAPGRYVVTVVRDANEGGTAMSTLLIK